MLSVALLTTAKLSWPSTEEGIKKIPNGVSLDHKKNEIMLFIRKWLELEIMLSKISHIQKDK
jgi:hypothetical protein